MSEHAGLLQAIVEHPDDDAHRLVYADWLEDHGRPALAALVRTQCALAGLVAEADDPFESAGNVEVMQLRPELRGPLLEPFHSLLPQLGEPDEVPHEVLASAFRFWVRRGLVEGLEIFGGQTAALFARDAPKVFRQAPLLHLRVRWEASRAALGRVDMGGGLDSGVDPLQARTLRALVDQECMGRLRTLDLRGLNLRDDAARCLLRCRDRLRLTRLNLGGNGISPAMAEQLRQEFGAVVILTPSFGDEIPF